MKQNSWTSYTYLRTSALGYKILPCSLDIAILMSFFSKIVQAKKRPPDLSTSQIIAVLPTMTRQSRGPTNFRVPESETRLVAVSIPCTRTEINPLFMVIL